MRRTLMIVSGAALVIGLLVVVGLGVLALTGRRMDRESRAYARAAVSAIAAAWDVQELESRSSPEFRSHIDHQELVAVFGEFRKLGKLISSGECRGGVSVSRDTRREKVVRASYVIPARFEAGPAEIRLHLVKHGDRWQINAFQIKSQAAFGSPDNPRLEV